MAGCKWAVNISEHTTVKTINECYNLLRIAVVQHAMRDYRRYLLNVRKLQKNPPNDETMLQDALYRVCYMEDWFVSEYGSLMCGDLGERIIEKVKQEVMQLDRESYQR